jgi:hypothetical protein
MLYFFVVAKAYKAYIPLELAIVLCFIMLIWYYLDALFFPVATHTFVALAASSCQQE